MNGNKTNPQIKRIYADLTAEKRSHADIISFAFRVSDPTFLATLESWRFKLSKICENPCESADELFLSVFIRGSNSILELSRCR
jgi:hypothetical protein